MCFPTQESQNLLRTGWTSSPARSFVLTILPNWWGFHEFQRTGPPTVLPTCSSYQACRRTVIASFTNVNGRFFAPRWLLPPVCRLISKAIREPWFRPSFGIFITVSLLTCAILELGNPRKFLSSLILDSLLSRLQKTIALPSVSLCFMCLSQTSCSSQAMVVESQDKISARCSSVLWNPRNFFYTQYSTASQSCDTLHNHPWRNSSKWFHVFLWPLIIPDHLTEDEWTSQNTLQYPWILTCERCDPCKGFCYPCKQTPGWMEVAWLNWKMAGCWCWTTMPHWSV